MRSVAYRLNGFALSVYILRSISLLSKRLPLRLHHPEAPPPLSSISLSLLALSGPLTQKYIPWPFAVAIPLPAFYTRR